MDHVPQLKASDLLAKFEEIGQFSGHHPYPVRNEIAEDLNGLVARAVYCLETSCDESDIEFANSALRIVERVAEFEEIETIKK